MKIGRDGHFSMPDTKNPALEERGVRMYGGGAEIRTLERFPVDGFQDRCLQPLGHPSATSRTINRADPLVKPITVQPNEKTAPGARTLKKPPTIAQGCSNDN